MITFPNIILLCWLVWLFYWVINWWNVKPTKESKMAGGRFRWVIIGLVIIIIFVSKKFRILPSCQIDWFGCHYPIFTSQVTTSPLLQIIGVVFTFIGLGIAIMARKTLAGNWSASLDLKKGHELITTGIYSYVRHPIYTGVLFMGVGTILVFQLFFILLFYLLVFISFIFRIKKEEELMTKTFPKEYPVYKKRVKTIIPFIY